MSLCLYPDEVRRLFTNREEDLHVLETHRQRLLEGAPFPYLALFGLFGEFTLPTFTRVEPYVAPGNAWGLDALAENGERWVVEVKWRTRRATYTDVTNFHAKALHLNARPWFIAKTGLTLSAAEYVRQSGILVSTEPDLERLAERLGVRFGK